MPPIPPAYFAQIMRLPQELRIDLLEFLGQTRVDDRHIISLIERAKYLARRDDIQRVQSKGRTTAPHQHSAPINA